MSYTSFRDRALSPPSPLSICTVTEGDSVHVTGMRRKLYINNETVSNTEKGGNTDGFHFQKLALITAGLGQSLKDTVTNNFSYKLLN